jgi:microcystin-dependent protein
LNCNSTQFSATTYPQLAIILGSTTTPDMRGKARVALDQSAGILSSGTIGFSPNTVGASGGAQSVTLGSSQLPASIPYSDPGHSHNAIQATQSRNDGTSVQSLFAFAQSSPTTTNTVGITINPSGGGSHGNLQPTIVGGIVMIRAA